MTGIDTDEEAPQGPGYDADDEKEQERLGQLTHLAMLVDMALSLERNRIRCQLRALAKRRLGQSDLHAEYLATRLTELEDYCLGQVGADVRAHPAWPWLSRVKGVGLENIAKVLAFMDIQKAPTISSLWKWAGYAVEDGKTPKRVAGEVTTYNARLRTMCYRLGVSLMRAQGSFYTYYSEQRQVLEAKYDIRQAPKKGSQAEPAGVMWARHVHAYCLRKMIKRFLACLWLVWAEAEGLQVRPPYAIERLGHTGLVDPWSYCEKPDKKR